MGTQFCSVDVAALRSELFTLKGASPFHFRFLYCQSFVGHNLLRVLEFTELPNRPYAAVSYVWRGLGASNGGESPMHSFIVEGAESADPISIDVLRTACIAAIHFKCELLWLDRLCIMQTNKADKDWQIKNMLQIYKNCETCLALPGGLVRLANLEDDTSWIHRAWTLQESLAPEAVYCLIAWDLGDAILQHNFFVRITEVEHKKAAAIALTDLLRASISHHAMAVITSENPRFDPATSYKRRSVQPIILSDASGPGVHHLTALLGALQQKSDEGRMNAIWRSAMLRTSSRPVDMVFSIMGLLGVSLEPSEFQSSDRQRATIVLARTLLQNGGRAEWLGLAPNLGPSRAMCSLPIMPRTSVEGRAYVESSEGSQEIVQVLGTGLRTMWWWLADAPHGMMDDRGDLTFSGSATSITEDTAPYVPLPYAQSDHPEILIDCKTNKRWKIEPRLGPPPYAVVIGRKEFYRNGILAYVVDPNSVLLMLLGERESAGLYIMGYAWGHPSLAETWRREEFVVGGPVGG